MEEEEEEGMGERAEGEGGGRRKQSSLMNSTNDSLLSPRTISTALQEDWEKRGKGKRKKNCQK